MPIILDGSAGITTTTGNVAAPDGTAALPGFINDGDTDTGIFFPSANVVAFSAGGAEVARADFYRNFMVGNDTGLPTDMNIASIHNAATKYGLGVMDSRSFTIGAGGSIVLGGKHNSAGAYTTFGALSGNKLNATDGDTAGILSFYTRNHQTGTLAERARLDGNSALYIGASGSLAAAAPDSSNIVLHANGPIVAGHRSTVEGSVLLYGKYGSGATAVLGTEQSSGGLVLAYCMQPNTTHVGGFTSTYGAGAIQRAGITVSSEGIIFYSNTSHTVSIGSTVNVPERARLTTEGSFQVGSVTSDRPAIFGYRNDAVFGALQLRQDGAGPVQVWTGSGGGNLATMTSGGSFLVGTTTSSGLVTAEASSAGIALGFFQNTAATPTVRGLTVSFSNATGTNTSSADVFQVRTAGAERATIRGNGGFANYQANDANLSDERLKTDIQPAASYLDKICAIPVKTFLYKDQTDTERNLGVLAQDVEGVAPELVDRTGFGDPPEGESPYLAIYQTDLQYALMKCIQEQQALITALTARVAQLEAQ